MHTGCYRLRYSNMKSDLRTIIAARQARLEALHAKRDAPALARAERKVAKAQAAVGRAAARHREDALAIAAHGPTVSCLSILALKRRQDAEWAACAGALPAELDALDSRHQQERKAWYALRRLRAPVRPSR